MSLHELRIGIMFLALGMFVAGFAVAADKTHDGKVVSASATELVMTDNADKAEHRHKITDDVKVTLDGKDVKITDLKKGNAITVTTNETGKVLKVAAKTKA